MSRLFQVLSDETRLRLVLALREGEKHVTELCRRLRVPQPTVSHHLGLLRMNGLVRNRRKGKSVFYSLDPAFSRKAAKFVRTIFSSR
jgi:DNA-binding transcriptional ArsR family regulator